MLQAKVNLYEISLTTMNKYRISVQNVICK